MNRSTPAFGMKVLATSNRHPRHANRGWSVTTPQGNVQPPAGTARYASGPHNWRSVWAA